MYTGSIAALVTPMTAEGALDLHALGRLLDHHLTRGTDALVVAGTTGEAPTLSGEEIEALVRETRGVVGDQIPVIAGCGTYGTASTVALARRVCAAGADALLVVTPYYNRPTQEGLYQHFQAVADAASRPVILYNVPSRTACDLLPETVERLAGHANVLAIKEATGNLARSERIIELCGDRLTVLSGDDGSALELMRIGARGVISVTANVAPHSMHALCAHMLAGDVAAARIVDETLRPLHAALFVESSPIPVKWAVRRLGLIDAGIRLPLMPLSEKHHATVEQAMRTAGVL